MITKREFCEAIIEKFCREEGVALRSLNQNYVVKSNSLAVAMEYLNLISDPDIKIYAAGRSGMMVGPHYNEATGNISSLTTRDILNLLPEYL